MIQETALKILKTGANVFLTGEPGSGKTHLVNEYIKYLRSHNIEPAITASTGIAATHIGGVTIHSWSGIGARDTLSPYEFDAVTSKEYLVRQISRTKVLIIDEISMLDGRLLDLVDSICRSIKSSDDPFGGMQVILVGDFFQLPPISRSGSPIFAFNSNAWREADFLSCYLSEQHRQEDQIFLDLLSAIRERKILGRHRDILDSRIGVEAGGGEVTRLFSHNVDVDRLNIVELEKLPGQSKDITMSGSGNKVLLEQLKRGCLSPELLRLKIGAVVMFTKNNFSSGFVNGTLGRVVSFDGQRPLVAIKGGKVIAVPSMDWTVEQDGKIKAEISQVPLRLAWAITVHKSQGMSISSAVMDLSKTFDFGQGYVALSRVSSLSGVVLTAYNDRALEVSPLIAEADYSFRDRSREAENIFGKMENADLEKMRRNMIVKFGGTLSASPVGGLRRGGVVKKVSTVEKTLILLLDGETLKSILKLRKLKIGTLWSHVFSLLSDSRLDEDVVSRLKGEANLSDGDISKIMKTFEEEKTNLVSPVFKKLKGRYSFDILRFVRALNSEKINDSAKDR